MTKNFDFGSKAMTFSLLCRFSNRLQIINQKTEMVYNFKRTLDNQIKKSLVIKAVIDCAIDVEVSRTASSSVLRGNWKFNTCEKIEDFTKICGGKIEPSQVYLTDITI